MATAEALPPEGPIRGSMVLLPTPPPGGFTACDLPRLIEAVDANFELLDGEVLMMAPATHWHGEVIDILKHALRQVAPREVVITTEKGIDLCRTVPELDVHAVTREAVSAGSLTFAPSDVRLAIEVVSPGTRTMDRTLRPAQYAGAGIKWSARPGRDGTARTPNHTSGTASATASTVTGTGRNQPALNSTSPAIASSAGTTDSRANSTPATSRPTSRLRPRAVMLTVTVLASAFIRCPSSMPPSSRRGLSRHSAHVSTVPIEHR